MGGGRKSEWKENQVYASLVRLYSLVMLWKTRENEIVQQNETSQHSESFRKTKRKCFTRKGSFLVYNPMRFLAVPLPFVFPFEANLSLFVYSSSPSLSFSCHFSLRRTGWRALNITGATLRCHSHGSGLKSAFLRIWVGSTVGTVKVWVSSHHATSPQTVELWAGFTAEEVKLFAFGYKMSAS